MKNTERNENNLKKKNLKNCFLVSPIHMKKKLFLQEHYQAISKNFYITIRQQSPINKKNYHKQKRNKRDPMNFKVRLTLEKFKYSKELMMLPL